jgi:hypothetical protein
MEEKQIKKRLTTFVMGDLKKRKLIKKSVDDSTSTSSDEEAADPLQATSHNTRYKDMKLCSKKVKRAPGFLPSEEAIFSMADVQLRLLTIASIRYKYNTYGNLARMTFVFTDGTLSPARGSY